MHGNINVQFTNTLFMEPAVSQSSVPKRQDLEPVKSRQVSFIIAT